MADDLTSNTPPSGGSPPPHPPKSTRHGLTTPPTIDSGPTADSWPPNETDPIQQSSGTPLPDFVSPETSDSIGTATPPQGTPAEKMLDYVDIVFDGPPSRPEGPRFVEVEDPEGNSLSIGTWLEDTRPWVRLRGEGEPHYWLLRIPDPRQFLRIAQDVPDNDCVICPACAWQFRAIPVNVQRRLATAQQYEARAASDLGRITGEITAELASIKASVKEIVAERDLLRASANSRDAQNAGLADSLATRETEITTLRKQLAALQKTNDAYVANDRLQTRTRREAENRLDRLRRQSNADQEEIRCLHTAVTDALINYAKAQERVHTLERDLSVLRANVNKIEPRPVHHDEQGPIYKDDLDEDALRDGFLRRKRSAGRVNFPKRPLNRDTPKGWMDPADNQGIPHGAGAGASKQQPQHPLREEFDRRKLEDALNTLEPGGQPMDVNRRAAQDLAIAAGETVEVLQANKAGNSFMDVNNIVGGPNEPELAKERLADFAAFEQRAAEVLNQPSVSLDEMRRDGFTGGSAVPSANASGEAGPHVSIPEDPDSPATTYGVSDETTNKPAGDTDGR